MIIMNPCTHKKNKLISCVNPSCLSIHCLSCLRFYLSSSYQLPHCPTCNYEWIEVIYEYPNAFRKKYLVYLRHILFIQQRSYLPPLQPIILYQQKLDEINKRMSIVETRRIENEQNELQLVSQQRIINKKLLLINKTLQREKLVLHSKTPIPSPLQAITICPNQDCVGFIMETMNEYKCGMCQVNVCVSCLRIVPDSNVNVNHECIPISKKYCPNPFCGSLVTKIEKEDITCCFNCHELFSWEKGREDPILITRIHDIEIPIERQFHYIKNVLESNNKRLYHEVVGYTRLVRNNINVVIEQYHTSNDLQDEFVKYMSNGKNQKSYDRFSKKILLFTMRRSRLEKEYIILVHFTTILEDLLQQFSYHNQRNSLLLEEMKERSRLSIQQLEKLNETHPIKGILQTKHLSLD